MKASAPLALGLALAACQGSVYPTLEETPRLQSLHVEMRDGVRIAIDVWMPEDLPRGVRVPTLMRMTRYWRAQGIVGAGIESDSNHRMAALLGSHGYAYVIVDARGSGASFGARPYELAKDEIRDYGEIVDWIAEQPWSNGRVGAFGVSYDGDTAELLLANRHPAVKAVAPLFPDFHVFDQLLYPGGVFLEFFTAGWGAMVANMDANDVCAVHSVADQECDALKAQVSGVKPVDGDDGSLLTAAAEQHRANSHVGRAARSVQFRDDAWGEGGPTNAVELSTAAGNRIDIEASGAAVFTRVGWYDAGTTNGALSRFKTFSNPQQVVIGAWTHGGGRDTDPFQPDDAPPEPAAEEQQKVMLAFFDRYLKDGGEPIAESSITYLTMGSREWHYTTVWPPPGFEERRLFLGPMGTLQHDPPRAPTTADTYVVDYGASTGATNRWHTQMGGTDVVYPDRAEQDERLLTYTSEPLAEDIEITGHPVVTLWLAADRPDAAVHAYLEAVAPDGEVLYLTEGQLRALLRRTSDEEPLSHPFGPYRTFRRADAEELEPGVVVELTFDLWALSVEVPAGYRLRLAIAGADADNFARYPRNGGETTLEIERNSEHSSFVTIPARLAAAGAN